MRTFMGICSVDPDRLTAKCGFPVRSRLAIRDAKIAELILEFLLSSVQSVNEAWRVGEACRVGVTIDETRCLV